jgi:FKBP-type peptidyl-prolyl cis-trans isomerase FkpA
MKKLFFVALASVALFGSCVKKTGGRSCSYDACAFVAPVSEQNNVEAYLNSNAIVAIKHCSGVFYKIDVEGTGANPTACSNVSVKYKGTLTNGNVFDQQTNPISFNLQQLITAWKNGIPLVKAGGKIILYVPPSLGYGAQQVGSIPPNSILIFEIELINVL